MTAAADGNLTLRGFLDGSRRRVIVLALVGRICQAVFWISAISAPIVAFRAALTISDALLATVLCVAVAVLSGVLAVRVRMRLREVLSHLELPAAEQDEIESASEYITDGDPFKRLALHKIEEWLRDHSDEIEPKRRWPRQATYGVPALIALLLLWWFTPSWVRPPHTQTVASNPPTAAPLESHDEATASTSAPANSNSPPSSGSNGGANTNGALDIAAGSTGQGVKSSNAHRAGEANSESAGARNKGQGGAQDSGNAKSAGSSADNESGKHQSQSSDGSSLPAHQPPSGKVPSPSGAAEPRKDEELPRPADAPPTDRSDKKVPGGSETGGPDVKAPSNQKHQLPQKDVAAPKSKSSGPEQEREGKGAMDDPDAKLHEVGKPEGSGSTPIVEPDAAELENLPARRRAIVIEYFRALRKAAGATTLPADSGDSST